MANCCDVRMRAKGTARSLRTFYKYMTCNSYDCNIGNGLHVYEVRLAGTKRHINMQVGDRSDNRYTKISKFSPDDVCCLEISGYCRWSVQSAMVDESRLYEHTRKSKAGMKFWDSNMRSVKCFKTIWECAEELKIDLQIFSTEPGMQFDEHFEFYNGKLTVNSCQACGTFTKTPFTLR